MNFKTTIALLVILIALLSVSWFLGVFSPQSEKHQKAPVIEAKKALLIAPKLKNPKRIRLEIKGRGFWVFEKNKSGKWMIVEPIKAPAVSWEVAEIVSTLEDARKLEAFIPGKGSYADTSIKDTGLDAPLMKIEITDEDGRTIKLLVGRNVIASEDTYVKFADSDKVFIVDQNIRKRIKRDLQAYRDKQLWEIDKDKITELTYVKNGKEQYEFFKGKKGDWLMLKPVRAKADKKAISDALDKLANLSAEEFVEDTLENNKLSPYGLAKPIWKIVITKTEEIKPKSKSPNKSDNKADKNKSQAQKSGKGKSEKASSTQPTSKPVIKKTKYVLLIGVKSGLGKGQVYAKRGDRKWIFTLKEEDVKKFLPDSVAWRDKRIVDINKSDLSKIEISCGANKITLEKKNDSWRMRDKDNLISCDTNAVDDLIDTLVAMKAAGFVDDINKKFLKQAGLIHPQCIIKLSLTNKLEPIVIKIGKNSPSGLYRYVLRNGLEYVCAVSDDTLKPVFRSELAYFDKQMLKLELDDIKEIKLVRRDRTYILKRDAKSKGENFSWNIIAPVKTQADNDKVRDLLMSVITLNAKEYVARGKLSKFHLTRPDIEVTLVSERKVPVIPADASAAKHKGSAVSTQPASAKSQAKSQAKSKTKSKAKDKSKPKVTYKTIKQSVKLLVAKYKGNVYVALANKPDAMIAKVSSSLYDDLSAELIPTKIFAEIDKDKITSIELIRRSKNLRFIRKGENWSYPADPIFRADNDKLKKIISAMAELHAKRYVNFKKTLNNKYGLRRPFLKIVLKTNNNKQYWLAIGGESKAGRYAIANTKSWVFEIANSNVKKFDKKLKDLAK